MQNAPFCWPITIYYEDTDIGGLVYHANYLKYFERARTELFRGFGVKQQQLLQQEIAFVVRHMDIDFIKGATLDDKLLVETAVVELKRATLRLIQQLVDDEGNIFCRAKVKLACINPKKMKPTVIPTTIQSEILRERGTINS